jgi:hypothetical protein
VSLASFSLSVILFKLEIVAVVAEDEVGDVTLTIWH